MVALSTNKGVFKVLVQCHQRWYEIPYLQMDPSPFLHMVFHCAPHVWRVCHVAHRAPFKVTQVEGQAYNSLQYGPRSHT